MIGSLQCVGGVHILADPAETGGRWICTFCYQISRGVGEVVVECRKREDINLLDPNVAYTRRKFL